MRSIKILDCTLRDGGCVNNFNFGNDNMCAILSSQEESNVDVIELGYLDEKNGSNSERTQYCNEQVIKESILRNKKNNIEYVVMMDYGKFNVNKLNPKTESDIDGIRVAFHKKNRFDIVDIGKKIIEKGYKFYIQPMITLRYSDSELLELIEMVNRELPDAAGFYIVDSFGEMRINDMNRMLNLVDHNLLSGMMIGFHSHNNLQLSYSNAITMLEFPTNRDIMIDCSIMGMGKGAGNLNTELILEHLNLYYSKKYNIQPLLDIIDKVINPIHSEFNWGYSVEYYLSSVNHCTPSYARYFYNKHMLTIDQVNELLSEISEDKKISFDKVYAEKLYREYNSRYDVDDSNVISMLINKLCKERILLVAPGKSLNNYYDDLKSIITEKKYISIGLNDNFDLALDYVVVTRKFVYNKLLNTDIKMIVPSNLAKTTNNKVSIIDYKKWITIDDTTHESTFDIITNILILAKVKEINLVGFDGFSLNMNENYYDNKLRQTITIEDLEARNGHYRRLIEKLRKIGMIINFITPSLYDK